MSGGSEPTAAAAGSPTGRSAATALRAALDAELAGTDRRALTAAVTRLGEGYRGGRPSRLDDEVTVAAYAAYRMPATYAAVAAILAQLPGLTARTLLDLGGGTGAAAWAGSAALPTLEAVTVVDRSARALALGRRLAAAAPYDVLRQARWHQGDAAGTAVEADLAVAAYLLNELPVPEDLVDRMAAAATVVLVEPGTPPGHRRILAARDQLLAAGHRLLAPCPHELACPLAATEDWCHFATRLDRSALHRRIKGGELGYEDEKFAYVVTARRGAPLADGRILRHPHTRKGLVELSVCGPAGRVAPERVGRSHPAYRSARDARWGDPWPPPGHG